MAWSYGPVAARSGRDGFPHRPKRPGACLARKPGRSAPNKTVACLAATGSRKEPGPLLMRLIGGRLPNAVWALSRTGSGWAGSPAAKPSPATASACWRATPKPSGSAHRRGPPVHRQGGYPVLDPGFVGLNRGVLPARERSSAELLQWVRPLEASSACSEGPILQLGGHPPRPLLTVDDPCGARLRAGRGHGRRRRRWLAAGCSGHSSWR
jgi:hypothetical protein